MEPFDLVRAVIAIAACALLAAIALLIGSNTAGAGDRGQYTNVDLKTKACVQALKSGAAPEGCCSSADGYPLEAEDWGREPDGRFKVKITFNGKSDWCDVPDDALLKPNACGLRYAIVWWYSTWEKTGVEHPAVRCFKSGTEF